MLKKITVFMACILATVLLISTVLYAAEMVTGVAKSFETKTGRLVLQTASQSEATFSIPQRVRVYMAAKGKDTEVADAWQFLKDNLMKGTKVQLMHSGGVVNTIWIMEVPR
jgi:putative copper export protein